MHTETVMAANFRGVERDLNNSDLVALLNECLGLAHGDHARATRYAVRRLLREEYEDLLFALVSKEIKFVAGAAARRNRNDCSAGQWPDASNGRMEVASEQSTVSDDGGHCTCAVDGHSGSAPTSLPNDDGVGQSHCAGTGQSSDAHPSSPKSDAAAVLPVPDHGQNRSAPASLPNDGDGGQGTCAGDGQTTGIPTPSTNDGENGQRADALLGHCQRAISPSPDSCEGGHAACADKGRYDVASPQLTERDDEGQTACAGEGHHSSAPSSHPNVNGNGHRPRASHGQLATAVPIREPSAVQRAAAFAAANMLAKSSLDTFKIRDGRAIGDVRWREIDALIAENSKEAAVFRRVKDHGQPYDLDRKIREDINGGVLDQILSEVEKEIRNAA